MSIDTHALPTETPPDDVAKVIEELRVAFDEIQQPRTDFMLERFTVGQHDTEPQRYAQCVLELQIKYDNIRRAILNRQKLLEEIAELEEQVASADRRSARHGFRRMPHIAAMSRIDIETKHIDVEEQDRAEIGARREFLALYRIWKSFGKTYTREELNAAQEEYWVKRLTRQAEQDLIASGRVSVGSQESLKQIGRSPLPQLDAVREVEQRYLDVGNTKILVAVPTIEKAVAGIPCVDRLGIPSGVQVKYYNMWGAERSIAEKYNDAIMVCLNDGADFLLTVEDDTFPPPDALHRLLAIIRATAGKVIIGAWYPKRSLPIEGAPIIVRDGHRCALPCDGQLREVYTLPMGCTLFPASVFLETTHPWFVTTDCLTQDSFFSQKARDAGWTLLCDTSAQCEHRDRDTGIIYTKDGVSYGQKTVGDDLGRMVGVGTEYPSAGGDGQYASTLG